MRSQQFAENARRYNCYSYNLQEQQKTYLTVKPEAYFTKINLNHYGAYAFNAEIVEFHHKLWEAINSVLNTLSQ